MTIFYWHQHRLRDWAGGSRAPIALFWQMFIKRPRPLARLSISPIGGVLKIIHQAIVTAKMRRLRQEFVEAMHGSISAANRSDRSGAVLTVRLPVPATSAALDTAA